MVRRGSRITTLRLTNTRGDRVAICAAPSEILDWIATGERRRLTTTSGGHILADASGIVAVDRFYVRIGSARFERIWTR